MSQDLQILALLKKLGHGVGYEIPEEEDLSGLGANLEIMTPQEQVSEQEDPEFTSEAGAQGYFPIGHCMVSPGDIYCAHLQSSSKRGLFRYSRETKKITPVLENLATITRYKGK